MLQSFDHRPTTPASAARYCLFMELCRPIEAQSARFTTGYGCPTTATQTVSLVLQAVLALYLRLGKRL